MDAHHRADLELIFAAKKPMSKPPQSTVIFSGLPDDTSNWLVGVDTKFFTVNKLLRGIKLIPDELANSSSIRHGRWIQCCNSVIVFHWDAQQELFEIIDENNEAEALNYSKYTQDLGEIYHFTVAYMENIVTWEALSSNLSIETIKQIIRTEGTFSHEINTITPSREENLVLLQQLKEQSTSTEETEMEFTIINMKQKRDTASVEQISKDYLDKSWYFEQVFADPETFMVELEISYILFIVLGNFCAGLQWINLLKLILMCKSLMSSNKRFNLHFLQLFKVQLETIPSEYVGDTTNLNSAVDTKNFVGILENFVQDIYLDGWGGASCGGMKVNGMLMETWNQVKGVVKTKFLIDLDKLTLRVEDEFEVYDMGTYDEGDEDAPAIVE